MKERQHLAKNAPAASDTSSDVPYTIFMKRNDRWGQLARNAEVWAHASGDSEKESLAGACATLLAELENVEHYFAYPGAVLMAALREQFDAPDALAFARLARRVASTLTTGAFRHDARVWEPEAEEQLEAKDFLPPPISGEQGERPYFEVLSVTPRDPAQWQQLKAAMRKLRRADDPFVYELVTVGSFEDALIAVLFNFDVQAVVINERMEFESHYPASRIRQLMHSILKVSPDGIEPRGYLSALARIIKQIRPELDVYALTEEGTEDFAGTEDARLFQRVFYSAEEVMELHLSILQGVGARYETPYFSNLKKYASRPVGTFHALPVARGKSVFRSHWIADMGHFYGTNIFLAESSATSGGLDSLLEPTGNIKKAQELAARAFGAEHAFFATNGTSTSNKIVLQALLAPGDIALIDRNCHKSHHYAMVLAGAQPVYLEAYPMTAYSMYGAVPLTTIKRALLALKAEGKLDRVKLLDLTNCTFDGHMYNTVRVMEECLAIKPDLVFLWDEAWFGFARYSLLHRRRTAMAAAQYLTRRYRSPGYRAEYEVFKAAAAALDANDKRLATMPLKPDPDKVRIRVYQTHSTHKSMSALRQGSMMLVRDQDFHTVEAAFHEAFFTHTSTSPNLQILASLDCARRQMELEGYELTSKATELALEIRRKVNDHPLIAKYFHILTPAEMVPAEFRRSGLEDFGLPGSSWHALLDAMDQDEIALDPTRLTLFCGRAGFDGTELKNLLAERFDIQLNKTSRNSVLLQININNSRSDTAHLIKVLASLAREIDARLAAQTEEERTLFNARVKALVDDVPDLPNFTRFHDSFRDDPKSATSEGHMRRAFFASYRAENCTHVKLHSPEMEKRLDKGPELVAADFVIPYPPGFPIMVPGQVITRETIEFMRKLDVKEIHGYNAAQGLRVLKPEALMAASADEPHVHRARKRA
jgi:arginine decarboxylase